ncbi:MAG: sigma-70 family RNA polymerase sigma factor, partial [Planctomycetes bacterium]|nr:sigma-70 family RNA polymerase sigma factor [Planctomycetota bacterium]
MARSSSHTDELFWKELQSWIERQLDGCGALPGQRDDLVSEVLLRLFVASETQELRSPFAYARTVLRNLIRDKIRELDRFERVLAELAARPSEPAEGTEPCGDDDAELA